MRILLAAVVLTGLSLGAQPQQTGNPAVKLTPTNVNVEGRNIEIFTLTNAAGVGQFSYLDFSSQAHGRSGSLCGCYEILAQFRRAIAISAPQEKR